MDCTDRDILPYLPYILQDFWEIGSDPNIIISLIRKHMSNINNLKVLDLGCGKGAVSVSIAKQLNCECYGIDAIPDFISFSISKADEYAVGNLCKFEVGDIREKVKTLDKYDVVILGAVGQVFGNYFDTLSILNNNLNEGGILIIDDGYIEEDSCFQQAQVISKSDLKSQIADAGMQLIDEVILSVDEKLKANYDTEYENILKRCQELSVKHPDKAGIFINYSSQQKKEYQILKNDITCSTMLVKRKT